MQIIFDSRYPTHPDDVKHYDTEQLRQHFLVDNLMQPDALVLCYTHYERVLIGSAVPVAAAVQLETVDALKADFFLQRRELGVINVGAAGSVVVDGTKYPLKNKEGLYVGMGAKDVSFHSDDGSKPAKFYFNSAPAHQSFPTKHLTMDTCTVLQMGSQETSNERAIHQLMIRDVVQTCQLQMGLTVLKPGSVWNTMPAHQHDRRMEAYFYFDLADEQGVCHFMGQPQQTRHIWMANEQAVVSPAWSIHSGCGTSNYAFIWGMAGENLDYHDMDKFPPSDLR
ncbi:5-dehydro-4-deoxy-D-glucuronate isomerase [Alkalimonas collagenimarina]|uniref:4-deoxy-L-threo-5-hexosulose-uronate ketol-isomerase n=1 Tax=Alkalimonas collagenimarina TaxID=400390 RepID=A0ABT9H0T0_9GAMM|nr:5-dehydro-4-deoxy-D-glucuronate isomerase [Alkalimonas collagenimarina]MDP4536813.1 5-dehydro-4-deoxy-D-glucuronate isomerase [Alkalimonas collagenimarina]